MSEKLNAGDVCNRIVTIADRKMNLVEAAQLMRDHHVGCLVVADTAGAGNLVVGILTDRDIVTAVVAKELDPRKLLVEDVMSTETVTVLEHDSIVDLLATMRRKGLRRIPVTSTQGVLVGLVTLDDLLELMAEQMHTIVQVIETEQLRERKIRP